MSPLGGIEPGSFWYEGSYPDSYPLSQCDRVKVLGQDRTDTLQVGLGGSSEKGDSKVGFPKFIIYSIIHPTSVAMIPIRGTNLIRGTN